MRRDPASPTCRRDALRRGDREPPRPRPCRRPDTNTSAGRWPARGGRSRNHGTPRFRRSRWSACHRNSERTQTRCRADAEFANTRVRSWPLHRRESRLSQLAGKLIGCGSEIVPKRSAARDAARSHRVGLAILNILGKCIEPSRQLVRDQPKQSDLRGRCRVAALAEGGVRVRQRCSRFIAHGEFGTVGE